MLEAGVVPGVSVTDWLGDSVLNDPVSAVGVIVAADPSVPLERVACVVRSGAWLVKIGKDDLFQIDKTVPPIPTMLRHRQIAKVMIPQDVSRRRVVFFIFLDQDSSDKR